MNPLFNPKRARISKSGLERHRHLKKYEEKTIQPEVSSNIPGDWFYNEEKAEQQWQSLEVCEHEPIQDDGFNLNPFKKIDKSAQVIRSIIENFEMTDREFLMNVVELIDDEVDGADVSQQEFLMDARVKLMEMLNEHSDNSEAQTKMLQSLRHWFSVVKNDAGAMKSMERQETVFDVSILAGIVNETFENAESSAEKAMIYHRNIVDNLSKQMRSMTKTINEQKELIESLQKEASKPKTRRKSRTISDALFRKLAIQNYKIDSLESKLNQTERDGDRSKLVPPNKTIDDIYGDESEINDLEIKLYDCIGKIQQLEKQNKQLLEDNKNFHSQICKSKATEINTETKIAALERAKVSSDEQIRSLQEQNRKLEDFYKQKMEDLRIEFENNNKDDQISELNMKHQKEIDDLKKTLKQQFDRDIALFEKKSKKHYDDLIETVKEGETGKLMKSLTSKYEEELERQRVNFENTMYQTNGAHNSRITLLLRHYDNTIKRMNEASKIEIDKLNKEKEMEMENLKYQLQENNTQEKFKEHEEFAAKLGELKKEFVNIKDSLEQKVQRLEMENEMYKQIIENNELQDEVTQLEKIDEERPEEDMDNVLNDVIQKMNHEKVEKEVNERLKILLNNQRNFLDKYRGWQTENIKYVTCAQMYKGIDKMRDKTMSGLTKLHDLIDSKLATKDEIEKTISEVLTAVSESELMVEEVSSSPPSIPINTVESKVTQLQSKVLILSNENQIMKDALDKMNAAAKNDKEHNICDMIIKNSAQQLNELNEAKEQIKNLKEQIAEAHVDKEDKQVDCFPIVKSEETQAVPDIQDKEVQFEGEKEEVEIQNSVETTDVETQKDFNIIPPQKAFKEPIKSKNTHFVQSQNEVIYEQNPVEFVSEAFSPFFSPNNLSQPGSDSATPIISPRVVCEHCHCTIPISKELTDIHSVVDPVVECPQCHEPVTVHLIRNIPKLDIDGDAMQKIEDKEKDIKSSVQELINMKQEMRSKSGTATPLTKSGTNSSRRPSSATQSSSQVDKALIVSKPSTPKDGKRIVKIQVPYHFTDSLSDTLSFERFEEDKISAGVSARIFVQQADEEEFTTDQIKTINDKETEINNQIEDLIELRINSKLNSPQDSSRRMSSKLVSPQESERRSPLMKSTQESGRRSASATNSQHNSGRKTSSTHNSSRRSGRKIELVLVEHEAISIYPAMPKPKREKKLNLKLSSVCLSEVENELEAKSTCSFISQDSFDILNTHKDLQKSNYSLTLSPRKDDSVIVEKDEKEIQTIPEQEPENAETEQKEVQKENEQEKPKEKTNVSVNYCKAINHVFDYYVPSKPVKKDHPVIYTSSSSLIIDVFSEQKATKPKVSFEQLKKIRNENEQIKTMHSQLSSYMKDLVDRHKEIIEYLASSIMQKSKELESEETQEHQTEEAKEKRIRQEAAAKIAAVIKERELAIEEQNETTQQLQKKKEEIIQLAKEKDEKEEEITRLSLQNSELKATVEKLSTEKEHYAEQCKAYTDSHNEQKEDISKANEEITTITEEKGAMKLELETAKIDIERLKAKVEMYEAEKSINLCSVSPFIIFSTNENLEGGFGLSPSTQSLSSIQAPSTPENKSEAEPTKEITKEVLQKVQAPIQSLKSKETPKLIMPKSSLKSPTTRKTPVLPSISQKQSSFTNMVPMSTKNGKLVYSSTNPNGKSYYERNTIEIRTVHEKVLNNMKKRLDNLDILLQQKTSEIISVKDSKEKMTLANQKLQTELENALKELKRTTAFYEASKSKINDYIATIEERDAIIKELRQIIAQFQQSANKVMDEKRRNENQEEFYHQITNKIGRTNRAIHELQTAYKGTTALRSFAERQMLALSRWEKMRKEIEQREEKRMIAVLSATGLITQTSHHKTTPRESFMVKRTSYNFGKHKQSQPKRLSTAPPVPTTPMKSEHKQKGGNSLKAGIVAMPLPTK